MSTASDLERYMLTLINEERTSRGLSELVLEKNLNAAAEDHSAWALDTDLFSHTGANGSSPTQRMRDADFDFDGTWRSGENIAIQSDRGAPGYRDDVEDLHVSLMNSPGHRANILNPEFEVIGIGIEIGQFQYDASTDLRSVMVTQNFAATDGALDLDLLGGTSAQTPDTDAPSSGIATGRVNTAAEGSAAFTGNSDDYAIVIQDGLVTVRQKGGPDGTETLRDVDQLDFADTTMTLYTGVTDLTEAQLETFVEMYIAYFNRAPAAEGLAYWGTQLTNGMSLQKIAASFFKQPETQAKYPEHMEYEDFVTEVFVNVLGRPPAQAGLDYWTGQLASGAVSRPTFMLDVINGAKAATGSAADTAFLAEKTMIGTYFAATKGLMDVSDARTVMSLYDGSDASLAAAKSYVDAAYAETLGDDDAGLTIQIVGVADDPFG